MTQRTHTPHTDRTGRLLALALALTGVLTLGALVMAVLSYRQATDAEAAFADRLAENNAFDTLITAGNAAELHNRSLLLGADAGPLYDAARLRLADALDRADALSLPASATVDDLQSLAGRIRADIQHVDRSVELARAGDRAGAQALVQDDLVQQHPRQSVDAARAYFARAAEQTQALFAAQNRMQRRFVGWAVAFMLGAALVVGLAAAQQVRGAFQLRRSQTNEALAATARAEALHEQERVESLLQDMNHRIGNSLGMVSALLGLQRSRSDNPDVRGALAAARRRVHAVATAHRRLRLGRDMESVSLGPVLSGMADDLRAGQPRQDIDLHSDFATAFVSDRDAVTIGLLMSELVVNAFKHAFEGRSGGTVWVDTHFDEDGTLCLRVKDDGVGMSETAAADGLGMSVVVRMARQFGGELDYAERERGGLCVSLSMPGLKLQPGVAGNDKEIVTGA